MKKLVDFFKNNKKWSIALWSLGLLILVVMMLGVNNKENNLYVSKIEIDIEPKEQLSFLDSNKVVMVLKRNDSSKMLLGLKQENVHLDAFESLLEKHPFVEKSDVSLDLSGKLKIRVLQRNPVLRVYNQHMESYYVAKNGFKMPLHSDFTPRVLIASGNILETLGDSSFAKTQLLNDLLQIANHCRADEFWHSQIEQLYVDNYMDIILIPKVGNHSIVFGSAERLESKFEQLKTFYHKGLNYIGWNDYKTINVKYEGQIVAEKKN